MTGMILLLILAVLCNLAYIQALECGLSDHSIEEDFQNAMRKCVFKDESSEKEDDSGESNESKSGGKHKVETRDTTSKNKSDEKDDYVRKHNKSETSNNCVLQCIFSNLKLVDKKGYPDQELVAESLQKYTKGREIKDFLQDSTDECFQLMDRGEKLDSCEYASRLTTCLAEKGRDNCADWETTNLPIKH